MRAGPLLALLLALVACSGEPPLATAVVVDQRLEGRWEEVQQTFFRWNLAFPGCPHFVESIRPVGAAEPVAAIVVVDALEDSEHKLASWQTSLVDGWQRIRFDRLEVAEHPRMAAVLLHELAHAHGVVEHQPFPSVLSLELPNDHWEAPQIPVSDVELVCEHDHGCCER